MTLDCLPTVAGIVECAEVAVARLLVLAVLPHAKFEATNREFAADLVDEPTPLCPASGGW